MDFAQRMSTIITGTQMQTGHPVSDDTENGVRDEAVTCTDVLPKV